MGAAWLVHTLRMVWTEYSLKEKRNRAIFQDSFQEEGFHRPLQDAVSDGARHGNHDAYISQICGGQRLLNKGGPESAHGKGVPWLLGRSLIGSVSFVHLVDSIRISQGQQSGKDSTPAINLQMRISTSLEQHEGKRLFVKNQKDPLAVDKIMKDLDQCRDGKVGFQSFLSLVAGLIIACNDYFVVHMKQKGRK
ncbi:hypothetical protein STEG23_034369 [Scotinomys teguina]